MSVKLEEHKNYMISPDVVYRYEPKIKDGTLFIYHIKNKNIFESDESIFNILEICNSKKSEAEIINEIAARYRENEETIKGSVLDMLEYLLNEDIVVER